jgi:hypothetical protein
MENKLASLKNIDELRIESPRSLFNSTKSELPNVQDFQFIKPIAKGGYRYSRLSIGTCDSVCSQYHRHHTVASIWRESSRRETCSR